MRNHDLQSKGADQVALRDGCKLFGRRELTKRKVAQLRRVVRMVAELRRLNQERQALSRDLRVMLEQRKTILQDQREILRERYALMRAMRSSCLDDFIGDGSANEQRVR